MEMCFGYWRQSATKHKAVLVCSLFCSSQARLKSSMHLRHSFFFSFGLNDHKLPGVNRAWFITLSLSRKQCCISSTSLTTKFNINNLRNQRLLKRKQTTNALVMKVLIVQATRQWLVFTSAHLKYMVVLARGFYNCQQLFPLLLSN
jgi:hypothetical protein